MGPIQGLCVVLFKFVPRVALLSLGLASLSALQSQAEEHIVIILEATYFPQKIILEHGDVVRFVNESGSAHEIFHTNGRWATAPIAPGDELLVLIEPGMTGAFHGVAKRWITGQLYLLQGDATDKQVE
ncbi:hypothetical protein [Roseobacter weihaiensis]|uniref:hypothetical protein n=1 Tax=Roseobacter weihaiensis TaxID=2763262 RepID=UPI001D0B9DB6|nr:hypothetical protein [Roseobacter sp. H9]